MTASFTWPHDKKIAVTITVLIETWSEGKAAPYSVQTTALKPGLVDHSGIAWGQYGGNEGIWRIMRTLDRYGAPGTISPNAQSAMLYGTAIRAAVASGHEIAAHGTYQDEHLVSMSPENERATIRQSLDILEEVAGVRPRGWCSPVLAYSEHTCDFLIQEGLAWHGDAKDFSMPRRIETENGSIVALPVSDFSDNRVLRSSPSAFFDVYRETFDYLYAHEPMSMLPMAIHSHWGGRPVMTAMLNKILQYYAQFSDIWFATSSDIADWMIKQEVKQLPYSERFFDVKSN